MSGVATRLWRGCEALGLADLLRRGYLTARAAPRGWRHREAVAGVDATFATTSWMEFKRVTTLHGEADLIARLLDELHGDEVVWDVGANVGIYACFLARRLDSGQVVGFEPEPTNAARLVENLRENAPANRWQTVPVALSERDGTGWLASAHPPGEREVVGSGHHYLADEGWLSVDCGRGETLVAGGLPTPDVLKIDVQGAELKVLQGMGDVLDGVEVIYLEVHTEKCERYGTTPDEIKRFLDEAGFSLTDLGEPDWNREGVYHVRAGR